MHDSDMSRFLVGVTFFLEFYLHCSVQSCSSEQTVYSFLSKLYCDTVDFDLGPILQSMATQSSTPAWKIPRTEEPGRLQSMGSQRVGQDSATSLSLFIFIHWRRKWKSTPVSLPGESQGQRSLVGCRQWGRTESDMTDAT